MALTFHPDSMDTHHQFEVPLAFVNREARRAVLRWVHKQVGSFQSTQCGDFPELLTSMQGIEIRPQPAGDVMFARHFNPELDALYVPGDKWLEFCLEPSDRMFRPDLVEKHVEVHSSLGKLAVPLEEFLDHDVISWVPEMLEKWFVSLGVVLVVMDPQPDSIRGPWSWEVRGGEGWWLSWNKESAKFDLHEGSGGGGDGDLRKKILVAANGRLRYEMLICGRSQLEVRPVFGVRARR